MKAALIRKQGGPEELVLAELADPKPGPNEVVVAIKACALNHLDIWVRQGIPSVTLPMPHILVRIFAVLSKRSARR